jgi:hypothetical protein
MKIIVGALMLVAALAVSPVEASFIGTFHPGSFFVEIASGSTEDAALTILDVKKARVAVLAVETLGPGETRQITPSIPKNTQRLVVTLDFVPPGNGTIRIIQGTNVFAEAITGAHHEFVVNVTP